jgi:hypothetical protein
MQQVDAAGYPGRMSNRTAAHQLATLRLALRLTTGLLASTAFTHEHRPIAGDAYSLLEWLRAQLAPLARRDRLIAELLQVLNPERPPRRWSSPQAARRELLRLAARAQALAASHHRERSR